jgi:hypothetical protein
MKERPILFRGEMVRALLKRPSEPGHKSVTRRPVKPQPDSFCSHVEAYRGPGRGWIAGDNTGRIFQCPYGAPGDRLCGREKFCIAYPTGGGGYSMIPWSGADARRDGKVFYAADIEEKPDDPRIPWCPSIHLPRWASRLTLEVTGVVVERVQDITEQQARAEGLWPDAWTGGETARAKYQQLWGEMYAGGEFAWELNPWVWAVSFRRVEG